MHGGIIILENELPSRKFFAYNWPQIFVKYLHIFTRVNISVNWYQSTHSLITNTTQNITDILRHLPPPRLTFNVLAMNCCVQLLWAPAQRKRATMLYFANVFYLFIFYGRLILRPWLTEVRENFTRGRP